MANTARIDELEAFGVRPIELSIADIPVASTYVPSVETPSASLEFRVEPAEQGVPAYKRDEPDAVAHLRHAMFCRAKTWLRFTFRPLK